MNEETQVQVIEETGTTATNPNETGETTKPDIDNLTREYFAAANLEAAQIAIGNAIAICDAHKIPYKFNFDTDLDMPDGYGIAIIPESERVAERGNVVIGCIIAAVPEPETIASDVAGAEWARNAVIAALLAKLSNTARAMRKPTSEITALPFSVTDFITSQRGSSEMLGTFNAMASMYVKGLKKKGLDYMSKALLRSTLQSAEFAEQQFPRVPQANWENLLNMMVQRAEQGILVDKVMTKFNPAIFKHWLETRASTEAHPVDVDFSDLAELT